MNEGYHSQSRDHRCHRRVAGLEAENRVEGVQVLAVQVSENVSDGGLEPRCGDKMGGPHGHQKGRGNHREFRKGGGAPQMPRAGQHGPNHQLEF